MQVYFVETLTLRTWLAVVWPHLRRRGTAGVSCVYYIDGTRAAIRLATAMAPPDLRVERLDFKAASTHDEAGMLVWWRIYYEHMAEALEHIPLREALDRQRVPVKTSQHLLTHLRKQCIPGNHVTLKSGLWRALYVLHVCMGKARETDADAVVFLDQRTWLWTLIDYAAARFPRLTLVPVGLRRPALGNAWLHLAGREVRLLLEKMQRLMYGDYSVLGGATARPREPCVAVQYYGHFNLRDPGKYSDFFFWQQSDLPGARLLGLFGFPQDPLTPERAQEMARHGIRGLATRYRATTLRGPAVFSDSRLTRRIADCVRAASYLRLPAEAQWINTQALLFRAQSDYWSRLFAANNVKVYTTWYKYNADHCAIAAAIQDLDGVLAIYQRSYEGNPTPQATLSTDILFAFSAEGARIEALQGSRIDYCVTTGYLGDHRFALVRDDAQALRASLHRQGATRIAAYFDEGSFPDSRWGLGHERLRHHYAHLLEQVLTDPELGLVLKPKTPRTLRARLGPVVGLLDRALATGRCVIFESGVVQGSIPPAQAAQAADLAIHGSVASATAAVEAGLAGVRTVLIDDDGWTMSPLYRLEKGRVVFDDWDALWSAWKDHRARAGGVPGFGDWSPLLDELDPFRDGRAAERMGTYLKWLVEGYADGLPRSTVLADAAERYCKAWGADRITAVQQPLVTTVQQPLVTSVQQHLVTAVQQPSVAEVRAPAHAVPHARPA